jgi:hypothetical protein
MTKRMVWKEAAGAAASDDARAKLSGVTARWAAARQAYLSLWDAEQPDVPALRLAARRLEGLERARLQLANELASERQLVEAV